MDWLKERLSERTTWAALIAFASSVTGYTFAPELADNITQAGLAITALVLFFVKEEK